MAKRTPRSEATDSTEAAATRPTRRQGRDRRATQPQPVSDQQSRPAVTDMESAPDGRQIQSSVAHDSSAVGSSDSLGAAGASAATGRPGGDDRRSEPDWSPAQDDNASRSISADRSSTQSRSLSSEPSEDDIRVRAYHLYLERGAGHGAHDEDWYRAEQELKQGRS